MGDDGFYYRDGEKVGFVISVGAGDQVRVDIAQIAAQQLQQIGMDVTVEIPAQVDWGGQMAYLIGWGSPFDADDHTYKVFGTDKGANYSGYSNELVDKYLTEARQSDDPEVRAEAYDKFQEKSWQRIPAFAFICYIDANYVAEADIQELIQIPLWTSWCWNLLECGGLDNHRLICNWLKSERIYEERGSSKRKFAAPFFQRKEEQNGKRIRSPKSVKLVLTVQKEKYRQSGMFFFFTQRRSSGSCRRIRLWKSVLCKSIMKLLPKTARIKERQYPGYGNRHYRIQRERDENP